MVVGFFRGAEFADPAGLLEGLGKSMRHVKLRPESDMPPNYRVVRSCGLYHHYYAEQLEACREQLGGGHIPIDDKPAAPNDAKDDPDDDSWILHEDYCRICGSLLDIEAIPRGPPSPELARFLGKRS